MKLKFQLLRVMVLLALLPEAWSNSMPEAEKSIQPATAQNESCILPSPSTLLVTEVGSTWIKVTWSQVMGAVQYHITTRNANTGAVLSSIYVSPAQNGATIENLPTGTDVQPEIQSVCSDYLESLPATVGPVNGTIIIELVTGNFSVCGTPSVGSCTMGYNTPSGNNGCDMINGTYTYFQISDPSNAYHAYFRASKNTSNEATDVQAASGGQPFQFANASDGSHVKIFFNTSEVADISSSQVSINQRKLHRYIKDGSNSGNDDTYLIKNVTGIYGCSDGRAPFAEWQFDLEGKVSVSPNPFTDKLEITIPFLAEGDQVTMGLYNMQGQLVFQQQVAAQSPVQYLSTENLPQGVYVLHVSAGTRHESVRLIKTQ